MEHDLSGKTGCTSQIEVLLNLLTVYYSVCSIHTFKVTVLQIILILLISCICCDSDSVMSMKSCKTKFDLALVLAA